MKKSIILLMIITLLALGAYFALNSDNPSEDYLLKGKIEVNEQGK